MRVTRWASAFAAFAALAFATSADAAPPAPAAGAVFKDCPECPSMVVAPAGVYSIGSPAEEPGRSADEGPRRRVTIAKPFAVGRFEITIEEYKAFTDETKYLPSGYCGAWMASGLLPVYARHWLDAGFEQTPQHPAVCLNWQDAKAFVEWLARKTRAPYRLLSEAEWEYVARAGAEGAFGRSGLVAQMCVNANIADRSFAAVYADAAAVDCDDGYAQTAPVGSFAPNAFGVHDMIGNAAEWVEDCESGGFGPSIDTGAASFAGDCTNRILRGGAWAFDANRARLASRLRQSQLRGAPDGRSVLSGFRVARDLPAPPS